MGNPNFFFISAIYEICTLKPYFISLIILHIACTYDLYFGSATYCLKKNFALAKLHFCIGNTVRFLWTNITKNVHPFLKTYHPKMLQRLPYSCFFLWRAFRLSGIFRFWQIIVHPLNNPTFLFYLCDI